MPEPGIIMNIENLDRAQKAAENPQKASDKDLRHAVGYYRAYNRDVKRQAKNARDTRDYYESEWDAGGWADTTAEVLNKRSKGNSQTLRLLNGELRKRKNNR